VLSVTRCFWSVLSGPTHAPQFGSVDRYHAVGPVRIVGVDGLIAHGAQITLVSGIGETELVRARENVAGRVRIRVEALQLELRPDTRVAA
jgi:hypothetical protein